MGKRYLLDSNTVIDYIAGLHPDKAVHWLNQLIDEEINVSIITKIEVLSFEPEKDDNYTTLVDFFEASNIFELTNDIVNKTIQIQQKQKNKLPDAVIASTALVNGLILVSRNTKDFKSIPDLVVLNPYDIWIHCNTTSGLPSVRSLTLTSEFLYWWNFFWHQFVNNCHFRAWEECFRFVQNVKQIMDDLIYCRRITVM